MDVKTIKKLLNSSESFHVPEKLMQIMMSKPQREQLFRDFLKIETDVSYDWFHEYFMEEQAERKGMKQDFTPSVLGEIMAQLNGGGKDDNYFEPAAGSGGLWIKHWNYRMHQETPFTYDPRQHWFLLEELSDKAIPFLLFNTAIRGANGVILWGNSLSSNYKGVFFIRNNTPNYLGFSDICVMPNNNTTANEFNIHGWDDDTPFKDIRDYGRMNTLEQVILENKSYEEEFDTSLDNDELMEELNNLIQIHKLLFKETDHYQEFKDNNFNLDDENIKKQGLGIKESLETVENYEQKNSK